MDGCLAAAATLGVPVGANKSEIRRAFRALVKRVHPDVAGGDQGCAEAFLRLRQAFDLLMAEAVDPPAAPGDSEAPAGVGTNDHSARFFAGWALDSKAVHRIDVIDEPRVRVCAHTRPKPKRTASSSEGAKAFAEQLAKALALA